jgi:hypothetical protein
MDHTADQAAFAGWEPGVERSGEQVRAKAHELLAQLTLDEKIDMMDGDIPFWSGMIEMMQGGYADHPWPAGAIPRLGLPGIRFADGPRGVVMHGATTFPGFVSTCFVTRPGDALRRPMARTPTMWGSWAPHSPAACRNTPWPARNTLR